MWCSSSTPVTTYSRHLLSLKRSDALNTSLLPFSTSTVVVSVSECSPFISSCSFAPITSLSVSSLLNAALWSKTVIFI